MNKYQLSTKRIANGPQPSHSSIPHDLKWWSLKLISGTALIAALFLSVIYQLPSAFAFPIWIAQLLVILGGSISLIHYGRLKRNTNDISRPDSLEQSFGLFKQVRHPMYLGDAITNTGLVLLFPNLISALILGLALLALFKQAQVEDAFVAQQFPNSFSQWQGKTKLIFPFVY
jgi:protein-S-isoprenylcysteine O-methyltransferase Ste14